MKINALAIANTFAILDLILHPFFHLWAAVSPDSLEYLIHVFVVGWKLNIDPTFDFSPFNLVFGTLLEAGAFWVLGYAGATLYNKLEKK